MRANVLAALRGEGGPSREESAAWRRNQRVNLGAALVAKRPWFTGEIDPGDPSLFPPSWSSDPVNAAYVRRFLGLASRAASRSSG